MNWCESPRFGDQDQRNDSTCGLRSQTYFSLRPSALLVFSYPIKYLIQRCCGQRVLLWARVRFQQSFEIGGPNFEQLRTFEFNCAPNAFKLKNMSLTIIPHLCSKDSAGKLGLNSRSCESCFLGAIVMLMVIPMAISIPWCVIRATCWIANSSRMKFSSLIQAREVLVSF